MPKLTYKPEGAEPQSWEFSFGKLMSPERIVIEKLTGLDSWDEVQQRFWANSTRVVGALLYVLMKRQHPVMKPTDLEFCDDDYELDMTDAEKRAFIARIEGDPSTRDDPEVLAELEAVRATLPEADGDGTESAPKAATSDSVSST